MTDAGAQSTPPERGREGQDGTREDRRSHNTALQRQLYGEPVGDLVRRVVGALGLTQSAVAGVLGLSPAMLSQLMSGQRVKIGNPLAVSRLQALLALADEAGDLTRSELAARLDEIGRSRATLATSQLATGSREAAELVRRLLHAVASGQQLTAAEQRLRDVAPGLAELVRVYGTGTVADAESHLRSLPGVLRPSP